ncbi:MAG: uroporphyrinogen-III synthase, partial [Hyphomonas sp.]
NVSIQPLIVYRARPTTVAAPTEFDAILIHSPRAAKILAERGGARLSHAVTVCISAAAAVPLVDLGLTPAVAQTPDEATLLTILKAALGKRDAAV